EVAAAVGPRLEMFRSGERTLRRIEQHAAGERKIEIDDDRQESEKAEDREIRRDEHPRDPWNAQYTLERAHRSINRIHRRGAGACRQLEQPISCRVHDRERELARY